MTAWIAKAMNYMGSFLCHRCRRHWIVKHVDVYRVCVAWAEGIRAPELADF